MNKPFYKQFILFFILFLSLLFSQNKELSNILSKNEINYLTKKQRLNLCIDPDWMPFEKIDEKGNHIGLSKDYFNYFQEKLEIPINLIKTSSWIETIEYMKRRECDILSLAMSSKERKEFLNFSSAYIVTPLVLVTKSIDRAMPLRMSVKVQCGRRCHL